MKSDKYCQKCGELLNVEKVPASQYGEDIGWFETHIIHPYSDYDRNSGEANYVKLYRCPKERWFNSHDNFMTKDLIH